MTDTVNKAGKSKIYCSAEWHLARIKPDFAGTVYSHALRLAHESDDYHCSVPMMSHYFGKTEPLIRKCFRTLKRVGLFIETDRVLGKAVNYRPVTHVEWMTKHPNQCVEKTDKTGDKDSLAHRLYAVGAGKVKFLFFPTVVTRLRKNGFPDDQIVDEWKDFLASPNEVEAQPRSFYCNGIIRRFDEFLAMKKAFYALELYAQPLSQHDGG